MSASTRSRKGQTSLEFIAMLSFMMIAFAAFYSVFVDQHVTAMEQRRATHAEAIADRAAFELDMALSQGDGFSRNFTLPNEVVGADYSITVYDGLLVLEWGDRRVMDSTAAPGINGELEPGLNRVENRGGVLYVS